MSEDLWQERASLPELQAVLDPLDRTGRKNRYIDRLHRAALERSLDLGRGQRILDLGCGVGRLSSWLARDRRTVVGVDTSEAMLMAARRRSESPNPSFVRYDGAALPFGDSTFDRVVSVFVLQHVMDDRRLSELLAEARRVMRGGGRFAIIEQVRRREGGTSGYIKHRTRRAYVRAFEAHGFRVLGDAAIRAPVGWSALAGRGMLPEAFWEAARRMDAWMASTVGSRRSYADRLMVFEKTASSA
jgi:SAM-dependent methyltransferase